MSNIRKTKKTVSFREVSDTTNNLNIIRNNTKKVSILKGKGKKTEKIEELKNEKTIEEIKKGEKKEEKKIEIPAETINNNINSDNKMKYLPTDEYFKATIQYDLEQGLLNIAMLHPTNPIKFLGNYLLEKSKSKSSVE